MSDLGNAILIIGCLCSLVFFAGCRVSRYPSRRRRQTIQLVTIALLPIYFWLVWDRPILASILPTSGLIILGNWLPVWACFFLGIYANTASINILRRIIVSSTTLGLVVYSTVAPGLGIAPECERQRVNSLFVSQTTPYTCSAASAATLLRLHDIPATEGELAELCLTRQGTHWMGVFRGLKLKTRGTGWTVVAEPFNKALLANLDKPCVLSLNIDVDGFSSEYDHGFSDNVGHTVVYLGSSAGDCSVVFDPSPDFGVEDWQPSTQSNIKNGVVLTLVPIDPERISSKVVDDRIDRVLQHRRLTAGLSQLDL